MPNEQRVWAIATHPEPEVSIAFPGGYLQCVVYVVGGPQGAVVIDPGSGTCEAQVLRAGSRQVWYEFPDWVIPTEVDQEPADGEVLDLAGFPIRVLHAPGHTPGCASYLVETDEGLVAFTGDLLTQTAQASWAGSEGFSVEDTLASTEKLLTGR